MNSFIFESSKYKNLFPERVLDIHKTHPYYVKRGRLGADLRQAESLSVGIIRNVDKAPSDLRALRNEAHNSFPSIPKGCCTRCPDRLDMANPERDFDKDFDSWLSKNFLNDVNPFINSISGSILMQIISLIVPKKLIEKGYVIDNFILDSDMIIKYLQIVGGLYSYFDGGHSLYEMQAVLEIELIQDNLISIFGEEFASLTQNLFNDENAKDKAFKNTKDFYQAQLARADMHSELLNVFPKIFLNQNSSREVNLIEGLPMFDTSVLSSTTKSKSKWKEVRKKESLIDKDRHIIQSPFQYF